MNIYVIIEVQNGEEYPITIVTKKDLLDTINHHFHGKECLSVFGNFKYKSKHWKIVEGTDGSV